MESASSVNDQSTVFALMNVAGTTESNLSQIGSMNGLSVASVQDDKVESKMPEERHEDLTGDLFEKRSSLVLQRLGLNYSPLILRKQ